MIKMIEDGELNGGIKYHYIPAKDKPAEPNKESF